MVHGVKKRKRGCLLRPLLWIFIFFFLFYGVKWGMHRLFPTPYAEEISAAAEKNNLPPALLYGLIKSESAFDPYAESTKGAKGLMQLMDKTAAECAEKSGVALSDIFAPSENIALGAYYLASLLTMYDGNETCALAAYNAGRGRVDAWLENPEYSEDGKTLIKIPFPETDRYVKKVLLYKKVYEKKGL